MFCSISSYLGKCKTVVIWWVKNEKKEIRRPWILTEEAPLALACSEVSSCSIRPTLYLFLNGTSNNE